MTEFKFKNDQDAIDQMAKLAKRGMWAMFKEMLPFMLLAVLVAASTLGFIAWLLITLAKILVGTG